MSNQPERCKTIYDLLNMDKVDCWMYLVSRKQDEEYISKLQNSDHVPLEELCKKLNSVREVIIDFQSSLYKISLMSEERY